MYYYQHNIGDFDKATRHLTRLERSIYRDLIELYYDTEIQLNADIKYLCRKILAASKEEVTAVEQVLNEFFTKTPDGWYHDRCEEEIEKYQNAKTQKSEAGKRSAAARQEKRQRALSGRSTTEQQSSNGTPTKQEPLNDNQEPENNLKQIQEFSEAEVFEHWKKIMGHPKAKLDKKRKSLISAAVKLGYSCDDLEMSITGYSLSPFHMGDNDKGVKYNGLDLILRDASKIDAGIQFFSNPPVKKIGDQNYGNQNNTNLNRHERLQLWSENTTAELERQLAEISEQENFGAGCDGQQDYIPYIPELDA